MQGCTRASRVSAYLFGITAGRHSPDFIRSSFAMSASFCGNSFLRHRYPASIKGEGHLKGEGDPFPSFLSMACLWSPLTLGECAVNTTGTAYLWYISCGGGDVSLPPPVTRSATCLGFIGRADCVHDLNPMVQVNVSCMS